MMAFTNKTALTRLLHSMCQMPQLKNPGVNSKFLKNGRFRSMTTFLCARERVRYQFLGPFCMFVILWYVL